MDLKELKGKVDEIIKDLKDNGKFPKENNLIDYKARLNIGASKNPTETFLINFAKDIIAFSNGDGGMILIGIGEKKDTGELVDDGLDEENIILLSKIDLNLITQKFEKLTKVGVSIDLQLFQISTRRFYYLLIQKQNNIMIPEIDALEYKIKKGEIFYRASGKTELANFSTPSFNRFLQVKANEKSKEFMEIWSKLLPEMVDINPREVLIINPINNRVYGFNGKDNVLASSEIEIDKTEENGVFNIILNAISAGEIGKITTDEGKPLFKIVGEIKSTAPRNFIPLTTLEKEVEKISKYKFTNAQLKTAIYYLQWTTVEQFQVMDPSPDTINPKFKEFIWIEAFNEIKKATKVVFSKTSIDKVAAIINDSSLHDKLYHKELSLKTR